MFSCWIDSDLWPLCWLYLSECCDESGFYRTSYKTLKRREEAFCCFLLKQVHVWFCGNEKRSLEQKSYPIFLSTESIWLVGLAAIHIRLLISCCTLGPKHTRLWITDGGQNGDLLTGCKMAGCDSSVCKLSGLPLFSLHRVFQAVCRRLRPPPEPQRALL